MQRALEIVLEEVKVQVRLLMFQTCHLLLVQDDILCGMQRRVSSRRLHVRFACVCVQHDVFSKGCVLELLESKRGFDSVASQSVLRKTAFKRRKNAIQGCEWDF